MKPVPLKPSPRNAHVYAVVRFDTEAGDDVPVELRFTVKEIVTDPAVAGAEVKRLNTLSSDKGAYYFFQVTRIRKATAEELGVVEPLPPLPSQTAAGINVPVERSDGV